MSWLKNLPLMAWGALVALGLAVLAWLRNDAAVSYTHLTLPTKA